jgi:hypothetical protein
MAPYLSTKSPFFKWFMVIFQITEAEMPLGMYSLLPKLAV